MPKLTDAEWIVLMRSVCQAARNWRRHYPDRYRAEIELARAVDDAIARADSRPIEEQIEEAELFVKKWTVRLEWLRAQR